MMEKIPASVGILTRNSAATLARALESVKDFDDLIICDGGSTDDTRAIAARYGARVVAQDAAFKNPDGTLKDYAGVRNQCLDAARYDWFLYIDSDETLSPELHEDVARIVREPLDSAQGKPTVYRIPIGLLMDGRYLQYSSNYPGYQYRFFNKQSGARFDKPVHERIYFDVKEVTVGTLTHPWYVHTTRGDWANYFADDRRYRDLGVRAAAGQSFASYLRWTLYGSLRTALGTLLRTAWIRLQHGSRDAVPLAGELARAASSFAVLGRLTAAQTTRLIPRRSRGQALTNERSNEGSPFRDSKTWPSGPERFSEMGSPNDERVRLYYIANNRIPTKRAHGVQIVEMCSAFASAGAEVTLVIPRIGREADIFSTYGVEPNFSIARLPVLDLPLWLPGAFAFRTLSFARAVHKFLSFETEHAIVYTRGEMALFCADLPDRFSFVWETHIKPEHPVRYREAAMRATTLITVTKHYADEIPQLWGVASDKVVYLPDGVRLETFAHQPERAEARRMLGLPQDKKIVLYAGSDLPWKGLHLLREASEVLPDDVLTIFVGAIQEIGAAEPRRMFVGPQPYTKIPLWLAAADTLVVTGDPTSDTARYYTSPLKLFEYMASGRPIVATDLPAVRDILSNENAYLAQPTSAGLAATITEALANPAEAAARAKRARALVEQYSWKSRARAILAHISPHV